MKIEYKDAYMKYFCMSTVTDMLTVQNFWVILFGRFNVDSICA